MTVNDGLARLVSTARVAPLPVRRGGRVAAFDGSLVEATGLDAQVGSRARIGAGPLHRANRCQICAKHRQCCKDSMQTSDFVF